MSNAHMMPARAQAESSIIDLDEIDYVPTKVQVNGKLYTLKFVAVKDIAPLQAASKRMAEFTTDDIDEACKNYLNFFHYLCPEITLEDVQSMGIVKMIKLFKIFLKHISAESGGQTLYEKHSEDEKKKSLASQAKSE